MGTGQDFRVAAYQILVEGGKGLHGENRCFLSRREIFGRHQGFGFQRQHGIGEHAAAQHHTGKTGKVLRKRGCFLGRGDIAVKNQRRVSAGGSQSFGCRGEDLPMHIPLVEFLLNPGMDDEAGEGIAQIDVKNPLKFRGIRDADPGLDGNPDGAAAENLV